MRYIGFTRMNNIQQRTDPILSYPVIFFCSYPEQWNFPAGKCLRLCAYENRKPRENQIIFQATRKRIGVFLLWNERADGKAKTEKTLC